MDGGNILNQISDITLISDLQTLPKNVLSDLCTDLNLETTGIKIDLIKRIQEYINTTSDKSSLESANDLLLAGKTSCKWFKFSNSNISPEYIEQEFNENYGFNPFKEVRIPREEDLSSTPKLISAATVKESNQIYMRFMYKAGVTQKAYGNTLRNIVSTSVSTVYIDTNEGIIEVRGDNKKAPQIINEITRVLQQQVNVDEVNAPFENEIAHIADEIGGELIDATSRPDFVLGDFDDDKIEAIGKVLSGLDDFFVSGDGEELGKTLNDASDLFGNEKLSLPFSALILSGMDRIGLAGENELRKYPLFNYLTPNLNHHTGFIRFTLNEDGLNHKYTIRIGRDSKSIFFTTPVNEQVIDFIRKKIIL